jgi:hypothetical protein
MKNSDQHYKITPIRQDYKGDRYFRFNPMAEKVIQVCVHPGEEKKGKSNTFGIYLIHRLTFLSNYFNFYIEPCSKKEYEKNFNKVIEMLK